jgi:ketosteroid isomerase-like protein
MSESRSLDVVRNVYAAFGRGDLEAIISQLDPNVTWLTPGPPDMPTAGQRRGHAGVREFFNALLTTLEIDDFEPKDFLAQGERVVVLGTSREGPRAAGKLFDFSWVHIFTVRDGRIVAFEERADVSMIVDAHRAANART